MTASPLRICVITGAYNYTGVALAQVRFARALAARGHEVELVFGTVNEDQLPAGNNGLPEVPGVSVVQWGTPRARAMFGRIRSYLRERRPDIVFSAEDHLNDMVLLAAISTGSRAKISGSSRVFPLDATGHDGPYSNRPFSRKWVFKQVTRATMRRADALTCVSEELVQAYRKLFPGGKHVCVYNINVDDRARARCLEPVDHPWFAEGAPPVIVGAGTLTLRKGFADLIRAAGRLRDGGRHVRTAILGEGPMRGELEALVRELDLEDRVWLAGRVENPLKYFARSDAFVLSSYSEGLANVLVEAMMSGCTPVSTTCPTGPTEVLGGGRYGYLVPMHDPDAMADGIAAALDRPISPDLLEEGTRRFEADAVVDRHFEVLGLANR